jgi:Cof subfamily protein (haloacid dehalogenase superfamily)
MKNIICFDLDGTLVDESGKIHPEDASLLESGLEDVIFVLASGRSLRSVKSVLSKNNLFSGARLPFPLILQNGSLIYGSGEDLLGYFPFEMSIQRQVIDMAKARKEITYLFLAKDLIFQLWSHPFGESARKQYDLPAGEFTDQSAGEKFSKVMCISENEKALKKVMEACRQLEVEGAFGMPTIFEITPKNVNKGTGLKFLLERLGWSSLPVSAVGNDQNDFEMLKAATHSFAPAGSKAAGFCDKDALIHPEETGIFAPILERSEIRRHR